MVKPSTESARPFQREGAKVNPASRAAEANLAAVELGQVKAGDVRFLVSEARSPTFFWFLRYCTPLEFGSGSNFQANWLVVFG